jgi:ketosteroid isomerase-like protein
VSNLRRSLTITLACTAASLGCRPGLDVASETEALLATDRAWAAAAAAGQNADSVLSFWAEDAQVAMAGAPLLRGKAAIRQMVTSSLATPGFRITWTPARAVVAASGDLGYTTGTNEVSMPDSTGRVTRMTGNYLAVWRRERDGRWRNVEDYATPAPATAGPPP